MPLNIEVKMIVISVYHPEEKDRSVVQVGDLTQGCRWFSTEEDSLIMTCCDTPISLTVSPGWLKGTDPGQRVENHVSTLCIVSHAFGF